MALSVDFSKKTLAVITGASYGIGRTIAVELSRCLGRNSTIILLARSEDALIDTKNLIAKANGDVDVKIHALDLTEPDVTVLETILSGDFNPELAIIFHNVGNLGILDQTTKLTDIQTWRDYFDLNVFSVGILNSVFVKKLQNVSQRLVIVNITSLCGRQPFQDLAMYGMGKAAREIYFRIFAIEEKGVTVLNYSPGPVNTAMNDQIMKDVKHHETKAIFNEMHEKKTILTPLQTVEKLLSILKKGDFKSGDVIDYFD